jgi:hypothetical protein
VSAGYDLAAMKHISSSIVGKSRSSVTLITAVNHARRKPLPFQRRNLLRMDDQFQRMAFVFLPLLSLYRRRLRISLSKLLNRQRATQFQL